MKMKTIAFAFASCVLIASVCGAAPQPEKKKLTPEQVAANKEKFMRRTGGIVEGETKGSYYLFVDCTSGNKPDHARTISQMQIGCGIVVKCKDGSLAGASPFDFARKALNDSAEVGAVTVIYDGKPDDPLESVFAMDKISVINATPLKKDGEVKYAKRINAMMWRGISFTAGGIMPFGTECVMRNIFSVEDIDALKAVAAYPGVTQLVMNNAPIFGFAQKKRGLYYVACAEGWASSPTNEYQKAIWEKVKAEQKQEPTKGLTIEYDPRQGK